jgi:hypothetical protein
MPGWPNTSAVVSFICTVLQGAAALLYLGKEVLPWISARRQGIMGPLTLKRPFLFMGLILGSFITAGIGFWFVFHPPKAQNTAISALPSTSNNLPHPQATPKDNREAPPVAQRKQPTRPTTKSLAPLPAPQQPTYEQKCQGSACAQGPNSQAMFNQYGAPKLTITDDQKKAIQDAMTPYAGVRFEIGRNNSTEDSELYADRLKKALTDAGLVAVDDIHMTVFSYVPGGVFLHLSESGKLAASALANVMVLQGLEKDKVPAEMTNNANYDFMITVTPNR